MQPKNEPPSTEFVPKVNEIFVAGHNPDDAKQWELIGIFTTEAKAVAACVEWCDFVFATVLDSTAPRDTTVMPNCYYPHAEKCSLEQVKEMCNEPLP